MICGREENKVMLSTIKQDLIAIDGVGTIVPREYPNWYGIEDIGFIWHGTQSDPEIEYDGCVVNACIVEDTMWYDWTHDDEDNFLQEKENDEDGFAEFMRDNATDVKELILMAIRAKEN